MRKWLLILPLLAMAAPAHAISRHQSLSLTCDAVQATIAREGASIMRYPGKMNKSLVLYDRYVRGPGQCDSDEVAAQTTIPAKDTGRCPVLHCVQAEDVCTDFQISHHICPY